TDRLLIAAGNRIRLPQPLNCRDLDIAGALIADVIATGTVTIRAGGVLDGTLTSPSLAVEEGGGLRATVRICPEAYPNG
ncbi:MAG: polymer-forming cytoskeletal protein, partial [Phycisphaerae bacterium]|nr:polymer-forming cytoskeletal protein [Phycisphaerae bacterium]